MRFSLLFAALTTLVACKGGSVGEDEPADVVGDVLTPDDEAEVAGRTAYGFHIDGRGLWYISTVSDASCDEVVALLDHSGVDEPLDPQGVLSGGFCNLTLVADYEGVQASTTEADGTAATLWSLYCPMGEGSFSVENRHGHTDYYWSGNLWTGSPVGFSTTISGDGETEGYTLDLSLTDFSGSYSDVIATVAATGTVSGSIHAVWCPDLYQTTAFPN